MPLSLARSPEHTRLTRGSQGPRCTAGFRAGLPPHWVISLGGDRGQGPVYVRSASNRVEILCTAVKDAKCHKPTYAVQQTVSLFDHFVGEQQEGFRYRQPERLGGLEIDAQRESGRLHHRQVGGLLPTQDAGDIDGSLPIQIPSSRAVANQSAARRAVTLARHGRQSVLRRQGNDARPPLIVE